MLTKYFTLVTVKFNPFSASAKPVRLFLARIPAQLKSGVAVNYKVLTSEEAALISVTFKDKHTMTADPEKMSFADVAAHFDTYSRQLKLKESISE